MKRLIAGMVVLGLAGVVFPTPMPAFAQHRSRGVGGVMEGTVSLPTVGPAFVPPAHSVGLRFAHQPTPVHVLGPFRYPAATCWDFWISAFWSEGLFVPGHWERVCR